MVCIQFIIIITLIKINRCLISCHTQYNLNCYYLSHLIGGRNRKVAAAFVTSGKTIEQLETEMLNGQKLQGPPTAQEVNFMLRNKAMEDKCDSISIFVDALKLFF